MKSLLRTILALILGLMVGSTVNMGIILLSPQVIPPPAGVDVSNSESLTANIHLFQPKHFVFPFLAHALGTFFGALVAYVLAMRFRVGVACVIGGLFLAGGIAATLMIPAPGWFIALDLLGAYLPMVWLAVVIGRKLRRETPVAS